VKEFFVFFVAFRVFRYHTPKSEIRILPSFLSPLLT
jgi:hypothetical protein